MTYSQKRLERIERLKDDPYYIFDKKEIEKPIPSTSSDVDSIPIARLDDLMPIAPSTSIISVRASQCYSVRFIAAPTQPETILREDPQSSQQQKREFVVDREGEMPMFVKPSTLPVPQSTPANPNELRQSMSSTPVSVSSVPVYDAGNDEIPRSRSLDPIKVTRPKKKGATGKKKRTSKPEIAAT